MCEGGVSGTARNSACKKSAGHGDNVSKPHMGSESSYSMVRSMAYSPATSQFATSLARSPPYNIAGAADDIFDPCVSLHLHPPRQRCQILAW
jgi:hypothetical protein